MKHVIEVIKNFVARIKRFNENKKTSKILVYIGKLISTATLIVLILICGFLAYYFMSTKMVAKNPMYEPKVNLYTIVSGSMQPTIKVYDVILTWRIDSPDDIKIGDVITFKSTSTISKDLIVTHRVVDIKEVNGKKEFVTKGDYNTTSDSSTAKYENIIGKVALKIPQLGRIQFFLSTTMGWFIVVLLPAAGVIIYDVIKLIKLLVLQKNSKLLKKVEDDRKQEKINEMMDEKAEVNKINDDINRVLNKAIGEIGSNSLSELKKEL